ncbi:cytochrome P450 [bacterium]|nr:cytochrome P450 [bacterium]
MIWDAVSWLLHPYAYFQRQARRRGLTWRAWLPGLGRVLMSGDPHILEQVIHHPHLAGGIAHRALRATLGEDHLIVMSGPAHRPRSLAVRQSLTAFSSDQEMARLTRQEFDQLPLGQPFSLHKVAHQASLRIMLNGLLGADQESAIVKLAQQFQASFSNPLLLFLPALQQDWGPYSPWGRLLRRRRRLQEALLQQLQHAPQDCIGARLAQRVAAPSLPVELMALLMFGHETTAATFAWCFALLQPEAVRRIRDGDTRYTLAFIEESLRLCPAVGQLTRVAQQDLSLGPWQVPRGSVVMPAIPLAQQNFPDPQRFDPERFLRTAPPANHYCPFGFGERICPGKAMALRQLVVMLETVLQNYEIRLPLGYQPRPQRKLFLVVPQAGTPALRLA